MTLKDKLPDRLKCSPLLTMESDSDIETIAESIVNLSDSDGDFFKKTEKLLLMACLGYLRDWSAISIPFVERVSKAMSLVPVLMLLALKVKVTVAVPLSASAVNSAVAVTGLPSASTKAFLVDLSIRVPVSV